MQWGKSIPLDTRKLVFERDNHKCKKCGATADLTIDHVIPKSLGGSNEIENLQTLCFKCNITKSSTHPLRIQDRLKYIWRSYEHILSTKSYILSEVNKIVNGFMTDKQARSLLQGEVAKLENKANDKLKMMLAELAIIKPYLLEQKQKDLKLVELENRIIILERNKPMATKNKKIVVTIHASLQENGEEVGVANHEYCVVNEEEAEKVGRSIEKNLNHALSVEWKS